MEMSLPGRHALLLSTTRERADRIGCARAADQLAGWSHSSSWRKTSRMRSSKRSRSHFP
jgi:hypothetical protein